MRTNFILLLIAMFVCTFSLQAQEETLEQLINMQTQKAAAADELQAQADALRGEADGLQSRIDKLSGWRKGLNGLVGYNFNRSNGWVANPNPNATSSGLNVGINGYLLQDKEKSFWHNKGIINKAWQDVDLAEKDNVGLFDNGTVDILNLSSLAGYKITDKLALSGLGELNTSLGNFLEPGTLDIGVGVTWLPIENLTVVIHPLNYRFAFSGLDGVESTGSAGAKFRADYTREFDVSGRAVSWSSTLTGYVPYSDTAQLIGAGTPDEYESTLNEFTWLNTFAFEVWNGIGVGITHGIRKATFESNESQNFTSVGLSYGF